GIAFLLHSYSTNEHDHIFTGVLLLGPGIHFHGLENYDFWFDHWFVYALITGLAFIICYFQKKKELIFEDLLNGIALIIILCFFYILYILIPIIVLICIIFIIIFTVTFFELLKYIYWLIEFLDSFRLVSVIGFDLFFFLFVCIYIT